MHNIWHHVVRAMLVTKSSVHLCLEGCDIFISVCKCKHSLKSITYFPIMPVNNAPVKQSAPTKATQSNVLVLMVRAYSIKDMSYLISSAVIINKNDCVDVFSGWSCLTCSVWKPVCTKGLYKSCPYWSATGAFGSVGPKRSAGRTWWPTNFCVDKLLRVEI